jgi:hypothetical protein
VNFNAVAIGSGGLPNPGIFQPDPLGTVSHISPSPESYGNYLLLVASGSDPLFLSQVGDIPADARLLQFDLMTLGTFSASASLRTFLNGTEIVNRAIATPSGRLIIGGDISAFAGQKPVTLEFEFAK